MLEKEMSVINSPEELKGYLGGQQANDCVIAVFNSLDGPSDSSMTYQNSMMMNLGYNTYLLGSTGTTGGGIAANNGVKIQDIETVASYGGLTATNLKNANGKIEIRSDGKDYNGNPVMIGVGNIETGHALIVKKIVAHANGNFITILETHRTVMLRVYTYTHKYQTHME